MSDQRAGKKKWCWFFLNILWETKQQRHWEALDDAVFGYSLCIFLLMLNIKILVWR